MRRRELREHIFKLLFMTQFNSQDEMGEQVQLYFEGLAEGEEKDLEAEKKIFGRDFAYIRDISRFSRIVGSYLNKQIEENC